MFKLTQIKDINDIIYKYKYQIEHYERYNLILKTIKNINRFQGRITYNDGDLSHINYYYENESKYIEIFINYDGEYEKDFMN